MPLSEARAAETPHLRPALVSIVMVFLDPGSFLQEAIASVSGQTLTDWNLLLVDDGSTDGSSELAREFARRDPDRVRYLDHPGHPTRGISASRTAGIDHATGRYVAFLDADDVWLPGKLEEQVAILEAQPEAAMVYGLSEFWYSWTGDPAAPRDFVHDLGIPARSLIHPPTLIRRFFLAQDAAIPGPTSILVRRVAIEQVGGFEETFPGSYEDQAFYAKICLRYPVIAVDRCWDRYRQHAMSVGAREHESGSAYAQRTRFLDWLARYLADQGVSDRGILFALRLERWRCRHPRLFALVHGIAQTALAAARRVLPLGVRRRLGGAATWSQRRHSPPLGKVRLGDLRRLTPISREFGFDRGLPIDRFYIERFLAAHAGDIQGRVLEVTDASYTQRFGGDRVTGTEVLDLSADNPRATVVADLADGAGLPSGAFDCVVLTQTLQFVYDLPAAVRTVHRILRPGGVVLATVAGITPISRYDADRWGHYWSLTPQSAARLFGGVFEAANVSVAAYGNPLTAIAFLEGLASEELRLAELDALDVDYPVVLTIRAVKDSGRVSIG